MNDDQSADGAVEITGVQHQPPPPVPGTATPTKQARVWRSYFCVAGRARRSEFVVINITAFLLFGAVASTLPHDASGEIASELCGANTALTVIVGGLCVWLLFAAAARRRHDLGSSA